jgi:hypothetical protein
MAERRKPWPRRSGVSAGQKDHLGEREHHGKVALAGGHGPVTGRWNGVSMDRTLGAYSILVCQKAVNEPGVIPDQIGGIICCDSHVVGGSGGSALLWASRRTGAVRLEVTHRVIPSTEDWSGDTKSVI